LKAQFVAMNKLAGEIKSETEMSVFTPCDPITGVGTALGSSLDNPVGSVDFSTVKTVVDGFDSFSIVVTILIVLLASVYFFIGVCQTLTVYLRLRDSKKCGFLQQCAKCSKCCVPCANVSLWTGAIVCVVISALFGDMCYTDPLKQFSGIDGFEDLGYLLTCVGSPPEALDSLYSVRLCCYIGR